MRALLWGSRAFWSLGTPQQIYPARHIEVQRPRAIDAPAQATPRYNTRYTEGYAPVRILLDVPLFAPTLTRAWTFEPLFTQWAFPQPHTDYLTPANMNLYVHLQDTTRVFTNVTVQTITLSIVKNQILGYQLQCLASAELQPIVGGGQRWANWGTVPELLTYRHIEFLTLNGNTWNTLTSVAIYECTISMTRQTRPVAPITPDPIQNAAGSSARIDKAQMQARALLRLQGREPNPFNSTAFAFGVRIRSGNTIHQQILMPRLVPTNPYDSTYERAPMFRTVSCDALGYEAHPPALVIT